MSRLVKRRLPGPPRNELALGLARIMAPLGYTESEIAGIWAIAEEMDGEIELDDGMLILVAGGRICGVGRRTKNS